MTDTGAKLSAHLEQGLRETLNARGMKHSHPSQDWASHFAEIVVSTLGADEDTRALAATIRDGVEKTAERLDHVSVAVTGMGWLGAGVPAVERTLADLVASAEREIILTAYSVTPGSERVWDEIEQALATGVRCTLVVDHFSEQHAEMRSLVTRLLREYPEALVVHDFISEGESTGLHAKVLVVDRCAALVGSANLSLRGMVTAHEMALVVQGPVAEIIADRVDMLIRSGLVKPIC